MKTFVLATALVAGACTTTSSVSTIPGMDVTTELRRSDYTILGMTEGDACAVESCFLGSCAREGDPAGSETKEGRLLSASLENVTLQHADEPFILRALRAFFLGDEGPTVGDLAENMAAHKAIEAIPTADAIVTPRKAFDIEKSQYFWIYSHTRTCAKVKGKAIHIKTDVERAR